MNESLRFELSRRQCELLALSLDTMLGSLEDPNVKQEVETLFELFDMMVDPIDQSEIELEPTPVVSRRPQQQAKIHLVLDRDSNILPFVRK